MCTWLRVSAQPFHWTLTISTFYTLFCGIRPLSPVHVQEEGSQVATFSLYYLSYPQHHPPPSTQVSYKSAGEKARIRESLMGQVTHFICYLPSIIFIYYQSVSSVHLDLFSVIYLLFFINLCLSSVSIFYLLLIFIIYIYLLFIIYYLLQSYIYNLLSSICL